MIGFLLFFILVIALGLIYLTFYLLGQGIFSKATTPEECNNMLYWPKECATDKACCGAWDGTKCVKGTVDINKTCKLPPEQKVNAGIVGITACVFVGLFLVIGIFSGIGNRIFSDGDEKKNGDKK